MIHRFGLINNKFTYITVSAIITVLLLPLVLISFPVIAEPSSQISVSSPIESVLPEENFTIGIYIYPDEPVNGFSFSLSFDSNLIHANSVALGDFFDPFTPDMFFNKGTIDNSEGIISNVYGLTVPATNTVTSSGFFCNISFTSLKNTGTSNLDFKNFCLTNITGECIKDLILTNGIITVEESGEPFVPPPLEPDPPNSESNQAPIAPSKPSGPSIGTVETIYAYSTSSIDIDNDQIYYLFDWGDETNTSWLGPYSSGSNCISSHFWNSSGVYSVKVKAKDYYNKESSWSEILSVEIQNKTEPPEEELENLSDDNYPIADFTYSPTKPKINENISFIDKSADKDGNISKWLWDFGDENTSNKRNPTHRYSENRTYIVTLTVWDENETTNTTYKQISVSIIISNKTENEDTPGFLFLAMFISLIFVIIIYRKKEAK